MISVLSSIVIRGIRALLLMYFFSSFKEKKTQIQLLTNLKNNLAH